eukprot:7386880-Prymnesium_polylepis.1
MRFSLRVLPKSPGLADAAPPHGSRGAAGGGEAGGAVVGRRSSDSKRPTPGSVCSGLLGGGVGGGDEGSPVVSTSDGGGGEGLAEPPVGLEGAAESSSSLSSSLDLEGLETGIVPCTGIQRTMSPGFSVKPSLPEKVNVYGSSLIMTGLPSSSTIGGGASSPVAAASAEEAEPLSNLAHTPGASSNETEVLTALTFVMM